MDGVNFLDIAVSAITDPGRNNEDTIYLQKRIEAARSLKDRLDTMSKALVLPVARVEITEEFDA